MHKYRIIKIPKKTGGVRQLEIPDPALADIQRVILRELEKQIQLPLWVYGVKYRGPADNARAHVRFHGTGEFIMVKVDIHDFFPSTTEPMVTDALQKLNVDRLLIREITQHCFFKGRLPQGAPTSPLLANIAALEMDIAIQKYISGIIRPTSPAEYPFYTRYFDDITISFSTTIPPRSVLIDAITSIAEQHGYIINERKTRIFQEDMPKLITGVVITPTGNMRPSRHARRKLRALLHHFQRGNTNEELLQKLNGMLAWFHAINPEDRMVNAVRRALSTV